MTKYYKHLGVKVKLTPENKCGFYTGAKCCTYITQEIDTPRSMSDFDYLLWQTAHRDVGVYKDEDGWYLLVDTKCTYLLKDGRCGIYDDRPMICREHSNDNCEFDSAAEDDFELYFPRYDDLLKYCKKRFKTWDKRLAQMESD